MSKFIEVTDGDNKRIINVENITYAKPSSTGCVIYFTGSKDYLLNIDEEYSFILSLLIK